MKIKIEYSISSTFFYPKVAHTNIGDSDFWSSGETWEKAREGVITQVIEYLKELGKDIPEPEEVEV